MMTRTLLGGACAALLALALPAAHGAPPAAPAGKMTIAAMIAGDLLYHEQTALPPGSEVVVQLLGKARADAPASVVAEQRIPVSGGRIPEKYRIDYDAVQINPHGLYEVAARVVHGNRLLCVSDPAIPVITRGSPGQVDLLLKKTAAAQ